jgi:hypothetical protein
MAEPPPKPDEAPAVSAGLWPRCRGPVYVKSKEKSAFLKKSAQKTFNTPGF